MQSGQSHKIKSGDAEIAYWALGEGRPVVLLHPFPVHHEFWLPVAEALATRYRRILRVMDDADVGRAPVIGVSIGGYAIFELWRKYRGRFTALGLYDTKAPADNDEARAGRLQAAKDVIERGTERFFETMVQRVLGRTTRETRPDLVQGALRMMRKMSRDDVAQVQRGMAERPDSVETLKTINVPTLLITG